MSLLILLCGTLGVFLIITSAWEPLRAKFQSGYVAAQGQAEQSLRAAAIYSITPIRLVQLSAVASVTTLLITLIMTGSLGVALVAAGLGFFVPRWWVENQRVKRLQRLEEVLPAAIDQLNNSVRAGLSLAQAIEEVSQSGPIPANEELAIIAREHQLGSRLIDSIDAAQARIGGRFFPLFATALRMNIERGGNLPEAMQRMGESFREIWRLEQKMITASAEARKSMRVIGAMPAVVALLVFFMQPDIADTLTGSLAGWIVLAVFALFYATGLVWLKRLMSAQA